MVFVLGMFMVSIGLFLLLHSYNIQFNIGDALGNTNIDFTAYIIDVATISIALGFVFIAIGIIAEEEMSEIETN